MPTYKRYPIQVDTDSTETTIGKTSCILRENMRVFNGQNQSIEGSTLIANPLLPAGANLTIGSTYDDLSDRIFSCNWNANGKHGIYYYTFATATWRALLLNSQVSGGLNFDRNHLMNGCRVVGGNLYLNDNYNQPRKINIQRAIVANNSNNIVYGVVFNEVRTTVSGSNFVTVTVNFTSAPAGAANLRLYWRVAGTQVWTPTTYGAQIAQSPALFDSFSTTSPVEYRFEFIDAGGNILDTVYSNTGAYTFPLQQSNLTLIVRPPQYPLSVLKVSDSAYVQNFTKDSAFQFTMRYVYATYETSVIGQWSQVVLRNTATEVFNAVDIKLPFSEVIPQDVYEVQLIVRFGNTGKSFIVNTWRGGDSALVNHNLTTAQLTYRFYNDRTGIAIGDIAANLPFHTVPLLGKSQEFFKNRTGIGDGLFGYDTPRQSSLSVQLTTITAATTTPAEFRAFNVFYVYNDTGANIVNTWYLLYVPATGLYYVVGTYANPLLSLVPPAGLTIDLNDPSIVANSATTGIAAIQNTPAFGLGYWTYSTAVGLVTPAISANASNISTTGTNATRAFKSNSPYEAFIEFLDEPTRRCGRTQRQRIYTDPRTYSQNSFQQLIRWNLSNTNALQEIPVWATHYRIARTKNLKYAFFLDGSKKDAKYATKDADGNFVFTETAYAADRYGVAIDISPLFGYGYGYSFQPGDIIEIIRPTLPIVSLSVIDQQGQWIICSLTNLGTLDGTAQFIFEIYTPYRPTQDEFAWEVGNAYPVNLPGTNARSYSVITDYLNGDISIINRNLADGGGTFTAEAMSPNDKYWKEWEQDIGFPVLEDAIGQQARPNDVVYSDTVLEGTRTNGLSSFQPLNVKPLPVELGGIQKLILASKIQEEGSVMLAIGKLQTVSLYLGERQIRDAENNLTVALTAEVIGQVNDLQQERGTNNPESVVRDSTGKISWVDTRNGVTTRYGGNGLVDISRFGFKSFWSAFSKNYTTGIIAGGLDPNPEREELLWSVPQTTAQPPKGFLVDFPTVIYPYDMYDGRATTLCFNAEEGSNFWQGKFAYQVENFLPIGRQLYVFKAGQLYRMNSGSTLFSQTYESKISILENVEEVSAIKVWENLALESSVKPSFTHLRSEYPKVQSSIPTADGRTSQSYQTEEGVHYASVLRDRLTQRFNNQFVPAQFGGDEIRCRALRVHFSFPVPCTLNFINVGYTISRGHTV